jgi:elongation factor Ts
MTPAPAGALSVQKELTMATATAITADQVKQLRDKTGAGMMECKAALTEAKGNMEEAITLLRKRGLAQAAKRAGRTTAQGLIGSYIHMGGRIGVLVEVNCESDFVARTEAFQNLVKEVAMHIAAADPRWVRREDVAPEAIEKEKSIYRAQMENSGKPANVLAKIIEGKLGSFYSQFVLLDQPFVRDDKITVAQLVAETSAKTGENISIGRFTRFRVGEGNE